jgi:hypothetical protein
MRAVTVDAALLRRRYTAGPTPGNVEAGFAAALIGLRGSIVAGATSPRRRGNPPDRLVAPSRPRL